MHNTKNRFSHPILHENFTFKRRKNSRKKCIIISLIAIILSFCLILSLCLCLSIKNQEDDVIPPPFEGKGTFSDPYIIANCTQFAKLSQISEEYLSASYKLSSHINCVSISPFPTIRSPFSGSLNGNKKSIKGLLLTTNITGNETQPSSIFSSINSAHIFNLSLQFTARGSHIGPLAYTASNSKLENIALSGSLFPSKASASSQELGSNKTEEEVRREEDSMYTGGMIGYGEEVEVRKTRVTFLSIQTDDKYEGEVGGLFGRARHVNLSVGSVYIQMEKQISSNTVGGLVGRGEHVFIHMFYVRGTVLGNGEVGGYIAHAFQSFLSANYFYGTVTGGSRVGGIIGISDQVVLYNDHAFLNVTAYEQDAGGLIGQMVGGRVESCSVAGDIRSNALYNQIGGLVGSLDGAVINGSSSIAKVSGSGSVGGLVGSTSINSSVSPCYISDCLAQGDVEARKDTKSIAGGLIGTNQIQILYSYSTGKVSGDTIGGLIGQGKKQKVKHCFWDIESSRSNESKGGIGKRTEEMKNNDTYLSWDKTKWIFLEDDYPRLVYPSSR